MKKNNIVISLVIIVVAVLAMIFLLRVRVQAPADGTDAATADASQNPSYTFDCPDGKSITAVFHLPDDETVDLALSDGRTMELAHAEAASGARYTNADESIVFWNKGMSAMIQENGTTTYDSCVANVDASQ